MNRWPTRSAGLRGLSRPRDREQSLIKNMRLGERTLDLAVKHLW
jgi:hypothetical protein